MITKLFLCVTASLLLCACGDRVGSQPSQPKDNYVELLKEGQDLSASAEKWNKQCGDPPYSAACQSDQQVLSKLWSDYIIRGVKYQTKGTDCKAQMRVKIVNFCVQVALFNVKCAGQEHTELQESQCAEEDSFLEQERQDLHFEMVGCQDSNK